MSEIESGVWLPASRAHIGLLLAKQLWAVVYRLLSNWNENLLIYLFLCEDI